MSAPAVEVWALPRNADPVCLTDLGDYEASRVDGEVGSVSLSYPEGGEGWELLHDLRLPYRRLEVEIRTDGTSTTARRAILTDAKGDATKPGSIWTITGLYKGMRMSHAQCPYADDGPDGNTVIAGTPGVIIRTLMVRAQARGTLVDVDFSSFSNTLDSNGQPWIHDVTLEFSPKRDYLSILQELKTKLGMCEWEYTAADELRLYNPDSRGVDRSIPGQQVTLEYGRDFTDGPVTSSNRDVGTHVLAVGVNGMYVEAINEAALALIGEKIERGADFGSVYDEATLTTLATSAAAQAGIGAHSYSHELTLDDPDSPTPGVDYDIGDWVLRAINGGTERVKVSQLVLRRSGGKQSCTVTLGDLLADQEVKTRQMLDSIVDGSTIVGTSTATPATDDGKAPAAPGTVSASSTAYYDGGTPMAQISASWPEVLTNADGTALDDLSGYEIWYRYEPGQDLPTAFQIAGVTANTSLSWGQIPQGTIVHVAVRAVDKWAHAGALSAEVLITTATDGDAPPVPSTPILGSQIGILTAQSDGLGASGEPMSGDFREFEVHLSNIGPSFAPDRPTNLALSETLAGKLSGQGTFPISVSDFYGVPADTLYGTTFYVKLVAVDKTGNASAPSEAGSVVLTPAGDGDIAAVGIGKLTAGIMSALMTVSGIIQTAATGARVVIDSTGIRCYSSDGATILFEFNIPSSLLSLVGKLTAGTGVGTGATIVVDPGPPPRLRLYPTATTQHTEIGAESGIRPDGSTGAFMSMETLNASSQTDGFSLWAWGTNVWVGLKDAAGFAGGVLKLQRTGLAALVNESSTITARVQVGASSDVFMGNDNGWVFVRPTGNVEIPAPTITLDGGNDTKLHLNSDGSAIFGGANNGYVNITSGGVASLVSNGTVKSFVVDHPEPGKEDRWLVHGCTEGPTAGVEYNGVATIRDQRAAVELPSYFEDLTEAEGRVVTVSPYLCESDGMPMIPSAAPSEIVDGRFEIRCIAPNGAKVAWRVFAARKDASFEVEPLRSTVDPHGDGPYRYLTPRSPAA